jgi:chemotaxis protein CheD
MSATIKMSAAIEAGAFTKALPYKEIYLHPGQMHVSKEALQISMILGSCAGICLYDRRQSIGGATHYMLPEWDGTGAASTRYGDVAINALLKQFQAYGSKTSDLEATVCGGACMFEVFRSEDGSGDHIGSRNINIAFQTFSRLGIVIAARDTGGINGRKIKMQSDTGSVAVSMIRNS